MFKHRILINNLQKMLFHEPYDDVHDLFHHNCVWHNVKLISILENLKPNFELLEIASYAHDLERGSKEHNKLSTIMEELNYDKEYINKVIDLINSHSFDDSIAQSIEQKVLYDADKVEYVNSERLISLVESVNNDKMSFDVGVKYGYLLDSRIVSVSEKLNYKSSKMLVAKKLEVYIKLTIQYKKLYPELTKGIIIENLIKSYDNVKNYE